MKLKLTVSIGQHSSQGRKPSNQDFHGAWIPKEPQLSHKGIALALADGISTSDVSHIASETAVTSFLTDYFSTSETWTVQTAANRVITANNAWLHSQTQQSDYRFEKDKGFVCTFSGLIIKGNQVHILHIGDSRIYRLRDQKLEQLTNDHRYIVSESESYLSRALGIDKHIEIDYKALPAQESDVFILMTDGVYEFVNSETLIDTLSGNEQDLDVIAEQLTQCAYDNGSKDNLTIQLVKIDQLPLSSGFNIHQQAEELPLPPALQARMEFDGYTIIREIHATSRSHVYLAEDLESKQHVAIKTPSVELSGDQDYLERFLLEEWIAKRINSTYVLKAASTQRQRHYLYTVTEYQPGKTLAQWLRDNASPDLEKIRDLVEQIAKGLMAFHRLEMLHQDIRPENILVDDSGTIRILDFGSTSIGGLAETAPSMSQLQIPGTALYTAPEYFIGEPGSPRSEQFSLAVLAYYMISGRFPYGTQVAKCTTLAAQRRLTYQSVRDENSDVPSWLDETLKKACHPNPLKRYSELSEFLYDLRHPNPKYLMQTKAPLIERNPVLVWQLISAALTLIIVYLLIFPTNSITFN